MDTLTAGLITALVGAFLVGSYLFREVCILNKKPLRTRELAAHIRAICDCGEDGCSQADYHYKECIHIIEHYGVKLADAGFDGTVRQLHRKAMVAMRRYIKFAEHGFDEVWYGTVIPDELGMIGIAPLPGVNFMAATELRSMSEARLNAYRNRYRILAGSLAL